ncbi:MAG: hypothetical protein HY231_20890 [Acidobacteria bacterium]|nr:hypothetical protein [Acidobacteriota bacterium]
MKRLHKTLSRLVVLTLLASFATSYSQAATDEFLSPQLKAAISLDADSFINASSDYLKNWEGIPVRIADLKAKAKPTAAEIQSVRADLLRAKTQLNTMKNHLSAIINKLKAANKYVEQDNFVVNAVRNKNAAAASKLQSAGGAHNILDGTSNIADQLNRVDQFLADPIFQRRAVGFNREGIFPSEFPLTRAAYRPASAAAPVFALTFTCLVLGARLIIKTLKGNDSTSDADHFADTCKGQ